MSEKWLNNREYLSLQPSYMHISDNLLCETWLLSGPMKVTLLDLRGTVPVLEGMAAITAEQRLETLVREMSE